MKGKKPTPGPVLFLPAEEPRGGGRVCVGSRASPRADVLQTGRAPVRLSLVCGHFVLSQEPSGGRPP